MDFLWSPWRAGYVAGPQPNSCVFCTLAQDSGPESDEKRFLLFRGARTFVVLNLYPYTTGHLLIAPYEHIGLVADAHKSITDEMMDLAKRAQSALLSEYRPEGFNLGMNLGRAAGAGVADHFHLHVLPRWNGDTNFTTTVGETRVLPEGLAETFRRLKSYF
jgi:ATP adenylyltransferase